MNKLRQAGLRVWISLLYVPLAGIMNWQVIQTMTTAFAGGRGDLWVHLWTFWWVREALETGQNLFFTTQLYFPEGVPLVSHNIAWLNIALWLPLQALFGTITGYNLMFIAIFVLNSVCMYFFALDVFGKIAPAFVAGLVFGFWPYTLSHYDHPNMILLFAVPLTLWGVRRLVQQAKWRYAWLTAVSLTLLGLSRWQHLVMASALLAGYGFYLLASTGQLRSGKVWGKLITAVGVSLLLMLPLAAPLILSQMGDSARELFIFEPDGGRTDLLSYIIAPKLYETLWGDTILQQHPVYTEAYHHIAASTYYNPFVGYVVLGLLLLAVWKRWSGAWIWLLLGGLYLLLALGSQLAINGAETGLPLLYSWLEPTFIGEFIRRPHRLNTMLSVPVGMLAGYGTAVVLDWLSHPQTRWRTTVITAVIGLLILAEYRYTVPMTTTPVSIPTWYTTLPNRDTLDSEPFGLLSLPAHDRSFDKTHMVYQTQHGYPIMTGHISRMPDEAWAALDQWPWLVYTIEHDDNAPDFSLITVGTELQRLHQHGIKYVVLHKDLLIDGVEEMWRDWFSIEPAYEDDEVFVYRTQIAADRDFVITHFLTDQLGVMRSNVLPQDVAQGGILRPDVRWASTSTPTAVPQACFTLVDTTNPTQTHLLACDPLVSETDTDTLWPPTNVIRGTYQLPITNTIPPGKYQLQLSLAMAEEAAFKPLILDTITVHAFQPSQTTQIRWGDVFALEGYDLVSATDALTLTMYWQSLRSQETSYKRFVHLVDSSSGEIVAQSDGIPLDWTYGTHLWQAEEQVRDVAHISLADVPAGEYEIWLGWYDQETGENLLVDGIVRAKLTAVSAE